MHSITQVQKFDDGDNGEKAERSRNEGVQKVTTNDLYHIGTKERLKYIGENWVTNES